MQTELQNTDLVLIFERLGDVDEGVQKSAIQTLITVLKDYKSAAKLKEHVNSLEQIYTHMHDGYNKRMMADVLSVIKNDVELRLRGNVIQIKEWGHQYVREMLKQLLKINQDNAKCYRESEKYLLDGQSMETYEMIENECLRFLFDTNSEIDAVDYLVEVHKELKIVDFSDAQNKKRILCYLDGLKKTGDDLDEIIFKIYEKHDMFIDQLIFYISQNEISRAFSFYETLSPVLKLQANFIFHKLRLRKFKNTLIRYALNDFKLSRKEISSTKIMGLLGECMMNYGIGDSGVSSEQEPANTKDVNTNINDCYLYGLVYCNTPLDFSLFSNKVNGLLAMSMNREEEEEVIMALIREGLEEKICNELLLAIFLVETYNKAILPVDLLVNVLNDIPAEKSKSTMVDHRAIAAFSLAASPAYISSEDEDLSETFLNLISQNRMNHTECLIYTLALSILYFRTKRRPEKLIEKLDMNDIYSRQIMALLLGMVYQGTGDTSVIEEVLMICFGDQESSRIMDEFEQLDGEIGEQSMPSEKSICFVKEQIHGKQRKLKHDSEKSKSKKTSEIEKSAWLAAMMEPASKKGDQRTVGEKTDGSSNNTENFVQNGHLEQLGLLSVALISMGNSLTSVMGARIINASSLLENSFTKRAIPLCLGFLYNGTNNNVIVDDLLRGITGSDQNILIAKIMGLGLVCSGSNNSAVIDSLKLVKRSSIRYLAQGLINLGLGTCITDLYNYKGKCINSKGLCGILFLIIMLLDGEDSVIFKEPYFFLSIVPSIKAKIVATARFIGETEYEFVEREMNVGKKVNITGMKGSPREITGIYKMQTPFTLKWNESGENDTGLMDFFEDVMVVND